MDYCKFYEEVRYRLTRERNPNRKKTPYVILRYLPITPRLQKLYASEVTIEQMTWHVNHQTEEGSICHSSAWRWVRTARAVRSYVLMLARYTYTVQSPTVMCMSFAYIFLTMVIHGSSNSKPFIDVYLELLIEELQNLWHVGVLTSNSVKNETFSMRITLMWTLNDLLLKE
ncbi:UNVERIFIED_CONTAM: hypothetical protein Sindi_2132100 [Sesamum indicum]